MTSAGGKHVRMLQHPVTTVQHICFALFLGRSNSNNQTWSRLEDSDQSPFPCSWHSNYWRASGRSLEAIADSLFKL